MLVKFKNSVRQGTKTMENEDDEALADRNAEKKREGSTKNMLGSTADFLLRNCREILNEEQDNKANGTVCVTPPRILQDGSNGRTTHKEKINRVESTEDNLLSAVPAASESSNEISAVCVTPLMQKNHSVKESGCEVTKKSKGDSESSFIRTILAEEDKTTTLLPRAHEKVGVLNESSFETVGPKAHLDMKKTDSDGLRDPGKSVEGEKETAVTNPYSAVSRTKRLTEIWKREREASQDNQMAEGINKNDRLFFDIHGLSEKANNFKWTIQCVVQKKFEMKSFASQKGHGGILNIHLVDRSGVDIRGTFFNNAALKFDPLLEENSVYTFSNGTIRRANAHYNKCRSQYEILFEMKSIIEISSDTNGENIIKEAKAARRTRRASDFEILKEDDLVGVIPISLLTQDDPPGWSIIARVTAKSSVSTWQKEGREIKVFSVELLDCSGVDIRACFFNEAIDEFHDEIVVGNAYKFSRAYLKLANKAYATCASEFELNLSDVANIRFIPSKHETILWKYAYNYKTLSDIRKNTVPGLKVDISVFVKTVGEVMRVTKGDGTETMKSDLHVTDDSIDDCVLITVWGDDAVNAEMLFQGEPLVVFNPVHVFTAQGNLVLTAVGAVKVLETSAKNSTEKAK